MGRSDALESCSYLGSKREVVYGFGGGPGAVCKVLNEPGLGFSANVVGTDSGLPNGFDWGYIGCSGDSCFGWTVYGACSGA